jgi:AraC family transcriptional regulator
MYEVQVRKTEPIQVASIRHTGPYQELGPVHGQLQSWISKNKIQPNGFVREIGYDNPMQTPPEKCRQEICVPVAEAKGGGEVEVKRLPQVQVISVMHKGGLDFQSMGPAYQALMGWAAREGKKTGYSIITYYTPPQNRTDAEVEIALVIE